MAGRSSLHHLGGHVLDRPAEGVRAVILQHQVRLVPHNVTLARERRTFVRNVGLITEAFDTTPEGEAAHCRTIEDREQ